MNLKFFLLIFCLFMFFILNKLKKEINQLKKENLNIDDVKNVKTKSGKITFSGDFIVTELEIHYAEGTISAATYGRGVWESPLNTLPSVGVDEISELNFDVYPNPASDDIYIQANSSKINVSIFSLDGKNIVETQSKKINVSKMAKGYYILSIKSNGFTKYKKLIIK